MKLLLIPFVCLSVAFAQNWSGIIDSTRATDWSGAGIVGGIPNRTTVCQTVSLTAGSGAAAANTTAINNAISSCGNDPTKVGKVVAIPAGTWYVTNLDFGAKSYVTLRGAGPLSTTLLFTGGGSGNCSAGGSAVCVRGVTTSYWGGASVLPGGSMAATWSGGYTQGANQITLTSIGSSGLSVGSVITLDQANETSDTNGVWNCDAQTAGSLCSENSPTNANGRLISGVTHSQMQFVEITAINGSTYTIDPPLMANNWRSGQAPGAYWFVPVVGDGIEDLTLDYSGTSANNGVSFNGCYKCWLKNIRSYDSGRNHVRLDWAARVVVRDSYFYESRAHAAEAYGVEIFPGGNSLVENNIFFHITSPIVAGSASGNVYAYNYSLTNTYTNANFMQVTYNAHHGGIYMNLFEGNQFNGLASDDIWGFSSLGTYFRNRVNGFEQGTPGTDPYGNTQAVAIAAGGRAFNVIGNVLGTTGYHTVYQSSPSAGYSSTQHSVYLLGCGTWNGTSCGTGPPANDSLAETSLFRWGNWDAGTGTVRFLSSEVPTTGATYINGNPVPSSQTLPSSFYLSSKPTWWGSSAWPGIGPDITGGNVANAGGHANNNPAALCFAATGADSTYGKAFDASNCYSAVTGIPPFITTQSLPNGTVGAAYSQTLTATGDTPITWDLSEGSLTACNLSLSASTGAITGTPASPAACSFTARATNAAGSNTKALSIQIAPAAQSFGTRQAGAAVKR